jgi:hypothetical protein
MLGPELGGPPDGDRIVSETDIDASRHLKQFSVSVSANQDHFVAERQQTVQHFNRLRAPGVVSRDDDQFSVCNRGFCEHPLQRRKHSVDVGKYRDCGNHRSIVP